MTETDPAAEALIPAARVRTEEPARAGSQAPSPGGYARLVYRRKWLLLLLLTLTVLVTYIASSWQPRSYDATLTLDIVNPTDRQLLQSEAVLGPAMAQAPFDPKELRIAPQPNTSLMAVSYRARDPGSAITVVNAVAAAYLDMLLQRSRVNAWRQSAKLAEAQLGASRSTMERSEKALHQAEHTLNEIEKSAAQSTQIADSVAHYQELKRRADADRSLYRQLQRKLGEAELEAPLQPTAAAIVGPVRIAASPDNAHLLRNCLVALAFAFLFGTTLAMLVGSPDARLRRLADIREAATEDVAGVLPAVRGWKTPGVIHLAITGSAAEEPYQSAIDGLRSIVLTRMQSGRALSILVSSPVTGDGRSTLAANLAVSCASLGKKVLLIDGDVRKPALHQAFLMSPPSTGFSTVVCEGLPWRAAVTQRAAWPSLFILPGGVPLARGKQPADLDLSALIDEARSEFDLILFDSPAFLDNPEAVDLAAYSDTALVMVRAGETSQNALISLLGYMRRLRLNVLGIVLNEA